MVEDGDVDWIGRNRDYSSVGGRTDRPLGTFGEKGGFYLASDKNSSTRETKKKKKDPEDITDR